MFVSFSLFIYKWSEISFLKPDNIWLHSTISSTVMLVQDTVSHGDPDNSRLPGLLLLLLPILCTKFSIEQPKWLFQMVSSLHQVCQRFPFKIRMSLKWFTTACLHHHMRYDLSFLNDLVSHHSCSFMTPILLGILVWMYHDYHHHFPSMQHIASKSPHGWLLFMTNSLKSLCLPYPVSFTSQYFS